MNKKELRALKGKTVKSFVDTSGSYGMRYRMTFTDGSHLDLSPYRANFGHNDFGEALSVKLTDPVLEAEKLEVEKRKAERRQLPNCAGSHEPPTVPDYLGGYGICSVCRDWRKMTKAGLVYKHKAKS